MSIAIDTPEMVLLFQVQVITDLSDVYMYNYGVFPYVCDAMV